MRLKSVGTPPTSRKRAASDAGTSAALRYGWKWYQRTAVRTDSAPGGDDPVPLAPLGRVERPVERHAEPALAARGDSADDAGAAARSRRRARG